MSSKIDKYCQKITSHKLSIAYYHSLPLLLNIIHLVVFIHILFNYVLSLTIHLVVLINIQEGPFIFANTPFTMISCNYLILIDHLPPRYSCCHYSQEQFSNQEQPEYKYNSKLTDFLEAEIIAPPRLDASLVIVPILSKLEFRVSEDMTESGLDMTDSDLEDIVSDSQASSGQRPPAFGGETLIFFKELSPGQYFSGDSQKLEIMKRSGRELDIEPSECSTSASSIQPGYRTPRAQRVSMQHTAWIHTGQFTQKVERKTAYNFYLFVRGIYFLEKSLPQMSQISFWGN